MRVKLLVLIVVCALLGAVSPARSHLLTVVNGNSTITVDPHTFSLDPLVGLGMIDWTVDGTSHLFDQWWAERVVGIDTEEFFLSLLDLTVEEILGTNQIHLVYDDPTSDLEVDALYTLTGGALGSGQSSISEVISLTNTGINPLEVAWFEYHDLDLNGTSANDAVFGDVNGLTYMDGLTTAQITSAPTPNAFQVAAFSTLKDALNDAAITNLDNSGSPFVGDATSAFQWNFNITGGGAARITTTKTLQVQPAQVIPEPSTLILLVVGALSLLVCGRRRRQQTISHSPSTINH
jgi:hypothetical protein